MDKLNIFEDFNSKLKSQVKICRCVTIILFGMNISIDCNLPRSPDILLDEFHRHLTIHNLDNVHRDARRDPSRYGTLHRQHSAMRMIFNVQRDTRGLSKPFVPYGTHVCVCVTSERKGKKGME